MISTGALSNHELIVVTGKGGVGKSAVAAALGTLLAARGRRTLLLEVDPRESLHAWLEAPPSGGELLAAGRDLFLQHLDPRHEMDDLVDHQLRIGPLVRRVLASPVYAHFADGAPGLKELAVLGHALRLVEGPAIRGAPRLDTVVLDAPASGHGVTLLTAPSLAAEVVRQGPFGRMATRLAALVGDPARCAIVVVAQAEEMPVQETFELEQTLVARLGRGADALVVNALFPPFPANGAAASPALAHWRRRRQVNERELARLRAAWGGTMVELPLLPFDRGPELVAELGRRLAGASDDGRGSLA